MFVQFVRFCGVGVLATALQYLILIALIEAAHFDAVAASAIGYVSSAMANYWLNYHFTFLSNKEHRVAATRFVIVSSAGLALNTVLMYAGVTVFDLNYLLVQIFATIVVLVWNFSANRIWTYRSPDQALDHDD